MVQVVLRNFHASVNHVMNIYIRQIERFYKNLGQERRPFAASSILIPLQAI